MLGLVESNLKLVKLFAQLSSTFPLFRGHPCVAQQSPVHLHGNIQHVEPTHTQCPAYPLRVLIYQTFHKTASQELEVLQESSNVKNSKRGKTRSVLDHQLFHYVVVAYFTAATWNPCSCLTTSLFCLFTLINEFAYQICSQALLYSEEMNIPQILSHDST